MNHVCILAHDHVSVFDFRKQPEKKGNSSYLFSLGAGSSSKICKNKMFHNWKACISFHVLLNLALMNIVLARKELPQNQERLIHNKKTLTQVKEVVARYPEVNRTQCSRYFVRYHSTLVVWKSKNS